MKLTHYKIWRIQRYLKFLVCTLLSYLILIFNGAKVGKQNLFDGVIKVVNSPGAILHLK